MLTVQILLLVVSAASLMDAISDLKGRWVEYRLRKVLEPLALQHLPREPRVSLTLMVVLSMLPDDTSRLLPIGPDAWRFWQDYATRMLVKRVGEKGLRTLEELASNRAFTGRHAWSLDDFWAEVHLLEHAQLMDEKLLPSFREGDPRELPM